MTETYKNLKIGQEGTVAVITIVRPEVLNALNQKTIEELSRAFQQLNQDKTVRAIILTGAGDKAFCAGADIAELNGLSLESGRARALTGQNLTKEIEQLDKPVIAAINGFSLGGGNELAMACDIRIASEKAKFGQPEVNLGLIPGYGGTQRLARLVGKGKAMELIFTGDIIDAQSALRIGLAEHVVLHEKLMETAQEMALKIASKGPIAIKMAKRAIQEGLQTNLSEGLMLEADLFAEICTTQDKSEGTAAFLEKRKPNFTGE